MRSDLLPDETVQLPLEVRRGSGIDADCVFGRDYRSAAVRGDLHAFACASQELSHHQRHVSGGFSGLLAAGLSAIAQRDSRKRNQRKKAHHAHRGRQRGSHGPARVPEQRPLREPGRLLHRR